MRLVSSAAILGFLLAAQPAACVGAPVHQPVAGAQSVLYTGPERVAVIPFLLRDNHLFVRGRVNQSDSLWFIVDTGAFAHAFNTSTAARIGIPVQGHIQAMGANGTAQGGRIARPKVELPGLIMTPDSLDAIPLDAIGRQSGLACDGIIGYPMFRGSVVEIDYARGIMTVREGRDFQYHGKGAAIPFTLTENHPYIRARITLPGQKPVDGRFVVDTGSSMGLLMSPSFVEKRRALQTVPRTIRVRLGGVGGASFSPLGRVERLEIGPYSLNAPTAAFRQGGAGRISAAGTAGNIGGDILRRFKVIFDYPKRRMILEPGPAFDEPFEADMSGLLIRVGDDSTRSLEVIGVQEDSPASHLKVAEGDILEAVDGDPVGWTDLSRVRQAFRVENRTYRLGIRRGQDRSTLTLTTRRLI